MRKKEQNKKKRNKTFQTSTPCIPIAGEEKSVIPFKKEEEG